MNKIIAIVGMCGAGKSVAGDYLIKKGHDRVYFGGVTMKELKNANLEVNPENEKMMREKLRVEYGMGAYAIKLLPEIEEKVKTNNVVLDGMYSWDELMILKDKFPHNLTTIAIIVDKNIRYERLSNREYRGLTNIEAKNRDISEIENIAKGGPIAYADYYIDNNHDIKSLENRLEDILKIIDRDDVNE